MKFSSLASTADGNGELFHAADKSFPDAPDQKAILFIGEYFAGRNIKDTLPAGFSIPDPPDYRVEVDRVLIKCSENKVALAKIEVLESVRTRASCICCTGTDGLRLPSFKTFSHMQTLQRCIAARRILASVFSLMADNGSIKVAAVFSGSPAEAGGARKLMMSSLK